MFSTILHPTDGSEHAKKALAVAADLGRRYGAKVIVLSAFEPMPRDLGSPYAEEFIARQTGAADAIVSDAAAVLAAQGVEHEKDILEGPPARAILDVAQTRGVDLIVMGSRGLGLVGATLLGSVSYRVIREAPCPVLIVR